jgi:hypothetical protein
MSAGAIGNSYGTSVVTINTKHHRAGRLELDGPTRLVTVEGRQVDGSVARQRGTM